MTLGEKIQELRRKSAMSQDVLAEKLEVSRQAVSKWERDEAVPETDKIVRIAQLFGVSTDYLLLNEQPEPQPRPERQYQSPPRQNSRSGDRIERLVRRHGYKIGYVPMAIGAFLCIIALLVLVLLPNFGKTTITNVDKLGGSGFVAEGDVPEEVLDAIYGEIGGGFFGGFDSQLNQMEQTWNTSTRIMATLVGVPMLLAGSGLIALGVFIVIKGKKISDHTL